MTKKTGFSLIELMIVLVILGIIAAIAVPSYQNHITRARRTDAQQALMDLAARLERYYAQNNTYATATIGTGNATTDVLSSGTTAGGSYTLSLTSATATAFTAQATPTGAQATDDTACGSLTYNSLGQRGVTGTQTVAKCWQ